MKNISLALLLFWVATLPAIAAPEDAIRQRIENPQVAMLAVAGTTIQALPGLRRFYEARGFRPAWTDERGEPGPAAIDLLSEIRRSAEEGLSPDDYHRPTLERLLLAPPSPGRRVDLELLFTDGWLVLASHYESGRVDPVTIDAEWVPSRRQSKLPERLAQALLADNAALHLRALLPQQAGYARLRSLLADYRARPNETAPDIADGPVLKPGSHDPRVSALRRRLGLQEATPEAGNVYDPVLVDVVRQVQKVHGLDADGIIGPATLRVINAGKSQRIDTISANLERWRWMPADPGDRHVAVNIAGFRLEAREAGSERLGMKVIVGRSYRRTPLFSDRIRYLVLNPTWEVPPSIAVQDKLPQLRKNPAALQAAGFVALRGTGSNETAYDPRDIDWHATGKNNFPYRLRQQPGPANALGRVKIMFPNRFNVYLHDTANPELFAKDVRSFSSGCIRLEKPFELTQWLLGSKSGWSSERLAAAVKSGATQTVTLPEPVPVHLQYWTAWVDEDGTPRFVDDIYQRDAPLAAALRAGGRQ